MLRYPICAKGGSVVQHMQVQNLPVGIDSFDLLRERGYYYVDKSLLIRDLVTMSPYVTLFTRPRRFGKTLNMTMLKSFFEISEDDPGRARRLFEGLAISRERDICERWMGKRPVIFLSLKTVEGMCFSEAQNELVTLIGDEASRFSFLLQSPRLTELEKARYRQLIEPGTSASDGVYVMSEAVLTASVRTLESLLAKHYGVRAIVLIDECDVPLEKARAHGYYDQMVNLLRRLFNAALKTSDSLELAVLTGCLRISKESIFTGLNNLRVNSITSMRSNEYFGFTASEVEKLFHAYGQESHLGEAQDWYDGYVFGDRDAYCPWDVMSFCQDLCNGETLQPQSYWSHSSGNSIVREFVSVANADTVRDIEALMAGKSIQKQINESVTYRELTNNVQNLWSALFETGYLTGRVLEDGRTFVLRIPNREVRQLFQEEISVWFQSVVEGDRGSAEKVYRALVSGDHESATLVMNSLLRRSISIRDTASRKEYRENFYQGFVMGLLQSFPDVQSNAESGDGYADILIRDVESRTGVVLELKYADSGDLEEGCLQALRQIDAKNYTSALVQTGMKTIRKYGVAFHKKQCLVLGAARL